MFLARNDASWSFGFCTGFQIDLSKYSNSLGAHREPPDQHVWYVCLFWFADQFLGESRRLKHSGGDQCSNNCHLFEETYLCNTHTIVYTAHIFTYIHIYIYIYLYIFWYLYTYWYTMFTWCFSPPFLHVVQGHTSKSKRCTIKSIRSETWTSSNRRWWCRLASGLETPRQKDSWNDRIWILSCFKFQGD